MWSVLKPVLGALMVAGACYGAFDMVKGSSKTGQDLKAVGTIVSLTENVIRVTRLARKVDHYVKYEFTASNGQTYSKSFSIKPEIYAALRKGQKIVVYYQSHIPTINASPLFHTYRGVKSNMKWNPIVRAAFLLSFFGAGVMLLFSTFGGLVSGMGGGRTVPIQNVQTRLPTRAGGAGNRQSFGNR